MADIKQLKSKIQATNNIKKITNALEIISTVKLQKTKKDTIHIRESMLSLINILINIDTKHEIFVHKANPDATRNLVIVIGSEKGLCGSLNSTLFKKIHRHYQDHQDTTDIYCVGKKTYEYFSRRGYNITGSVYLGDDVSVEKCKDIIAYIQDHQDGNYYKSIYIGYNIFKNTMKYVPVVFPLHPLHAHDLKEFLNELRGENLNNQHITTSHIHPTDLLVEPSPEAVKKELYKMIIRYVLYGAVLQNKTCESAARMLAMKGAKDNASSQISSLTLSFNKARQDNITKEIIEIAGAKSIITG